MKSRHRCRLAALLGFMLACANSDDLFFRRCTLEAGWCAAAGSEFDITDRACFAPEGQPSTGYCAPRCSSPCDEEITSGSCEDACTGYAPYGRETACFATTDINSGYLPLCLILCADDDECPEQMSCWAYVDHLGTPGRICLWEKRE